MKDTTQALLHIENLKTVISSKDGKLVPVDGVDITIPKGKTVGIVGESGCGKSMTAMSIMGLLPNTTHIEEGKILFQDMDLTKLNPKELRKITGDKISIIFQEPMTSLNPVIQVGKQVREAILLHEKVSKEEAKQRVIEIFRQVGIPEPERRYNAYPHQLSGGLRQRVMIGMAMVCNPDLLIADEPTTALDVTVQAQITDLMKHFQKEFNMSIIYITHDMGVIAEMADTIAVMYLGRVVESGSARAIFKNPIHPYTKGLLKSMPVLGNKSSERLHAIEGNVPVPLDPPDECGFCSRCQEKTAACAGSIPPLVEVEPDHLVRCFHYQGE